MGSVITVGSRMSDIGRTRYIVECVRDLSTVIEIAAEKSTVITLLCAQFISIKNVLNRRFAKMGIGGSR